MNVTKTCEIPTRKISLKKIDSVEKNAKGTVVGWEYGPPQKGERYAVYLGKGRVLRTSMVEEVRNNMNALLIKTTNSIYRIEYLKR